ncbi:MULTISPECIES: Cdc6/Cdc18 family protein [Haloarcula]|jgi:cell division control protein 6|uniref:ORC1-type DNA replication protein n=1 Tax=Haloarcula marismortui ATCC 33800 TaxID=662476 RepID=M0JMJ3_9EURY|nr:MULTISPECIES: AAA family ATPase [Haloarcula]EMA09543.1 orc1/cdc6 family replication initiation protein [Haloarcula sinaiiensis ATCC 33800]QUJ74274.1 AAA family ATPase [Haloarcula sinaiiensis ATCC 33800]
MDSSPYSTTSDIFAVGGEDYLKEGHTPTTLPERQEEILKLRRSLKPAARGAGAENTFLSGKAGQGKTAAAKAELAELKAFADAQNLDLTSMFFSCEGITSSYTLACGLCEELGGENPNGHPMQKVLDHLWDAMNDIGGTIIIVLDEIDNLGTDDKILYSLPRARDKDYVNDDVYPSIIGISNDLQWRDNLDPAAKDSLYDDSIFFPPYDAHELRDILSRRASKAFRDTSLVYETPAGEEFEISANLDDNDDNSLADSFEAIDADRSECTLLRIHSNVLSEDVIPLCAAYAAQDKGSARQAIKYLRKAAAIAESEGDSRVGEEHVRTAQGEAERELIIEGMEQLTTQGHLALAAVTILELGGHSEIRTRDVYDIYKSLSDHIDADRLAQRRMRDHLIELDMLSIIRARKSASGSVGGEAYTFELRVEPSTAIDVLEAVSRFESVDFDDLAKEWLNEQQTLG